VAAVLGERFEFRVLAEAVGEGERAVLEALGPAVAARLVEEDAVGSYRFAHALVRSTLEEALGPTRRAQLHLGAAAAIESTYAGRLEGRAAGLAAHYVLAGALAPPDRVVDALIDAGREAAAAAAWEQVAAHWRHALHLMDQGGGGDDRRADLLARLADLLHMTGFDLVGSLTHLEEAIALFAEAGDEKRVAVLRSRLGGYLASNPVYGVMDVTRGLREFEAAERVLEAQPNSLAYGYQQATLAGATGMWAFRPLEGLTRSQRAMQIAEHLRHDSLWVIGAMTHGYALVAVGHIEKGLPLLERAWETADRLDQGPYLGMRAAQLRAFWGALLFEPLVTVAFSERELSKPRLAHVPIRRQLLQGTLAWGYVLAGRLPEAERVLDEAGEVPPGVTSGPPLALWQGDWAVAEAALLHSRDRFREMGSRIDEAILDDWTAEARRLQGNTSGAEKILGEALDIALAAGADAFEAGFRIDLCLLGVEQGEVHSARQHLDRARELMSGDDWRGLGGRLAVAEAAVVGAEGDLAAAGTRFEAALAVLRHHCLPWEEAEAFLLWGRACAEGGAGAEAAKPFDAALAVYDRIAAAGPWRERVDRARATLL
jgi:hypothetical protein